MTMPLASCLPDFGPDDTPKSIEDHTTVKAATFKSVPGAPKTASPVKTTKVISAADAKAGSSEVNNSLKSVVRRIKLVDEPHFVTPLVDPTPPVDIDALLKEEGDKIRKEEATKAKEALAAAVAAERKIHEEARVKERAQWVKQESSRLAQQISSTLAEVERDLSDTIARIFIPFIQSAVRESALSQLRATIQGLINEGNQAKIEVAGPQDLVEAIRASLSGENAERLDKVTFRIANTSDVRILAGETVCTTQIEAWNKRITSALSGQ